VTYKVKEIFLTIQGEGANAGRVAVFCRFAGCNLWSGREQDREAAVCRFCDTDFVGGQSYSAIELAQSIADVWGAGSARRFVVLTGGEPLLQVDDALIRVLHDLGFEIAIETNGTIKVPPMIHWICVSPKAGTKLRALSGDELKLVYPQAGASPEEYENLQFSRFLLQPMDGPDREKNTQLAIGYCLKHPKWRLSLQMHKYLGIR
jgi:7-carboxy-7-deazaguanine synthase